jgi:hypothetical protein
MSERIGYIYEQSAVEPDECKVEDGIHQWPEHTDPGKQNLLTVQLSAEAGMRQKLEWRGTLQGIEADPVASPGVFLKSMYNTEIQLGMVTRFLSFG